MPTVALHGHNGNVGSATLSHLIKAHRSGKIKLVMLHRASSDLSTVPSDVEKRVIDLESGDLATNQKAVAGLNIVISTIGTTSIMAQMPLVEALKDSPDLLTFIPSEFGLVWTQKEIENPKLAFLGGKDKIADRARELGVPVTIVHTGIYPEVLFMAQLFGISPKANKVEVFRHSRTNPSPISTIPFVGAAVAQLAVTRSNDIANKNFDAIEYEATGDDFIQAFTKVHGSTTEVVELSEADWKTQLEAGGLTSLGGGYKRKWGDGDFTWIGEKVKVEGWESKSLEATAKMYV